MFISQKVFGYAVEIEWYLRYLRKPVRIKLSVFTPNEKTAVKVRLPQV